MSFGTLKRIDMLDALIVVSQALPALTYGRLLEPKVIGTGLAPLFGSCLAALRTAGLS
ncbi:hypothetical protein N7373_10505 [Achromobacter mucicolens]|uniref:hypothetical protein n=1 Tax=Achromobacter mucicolens TaxID=1389922 RepID=UPI00244B5079|nr:hypothetical protein [Achromobacter mucicolens]MDH0091871.1 hypothetical protein [Achromobacter mucicolens]